MVNIQRLIYGGNMLRKYIIILLLILLVSTMATGCMGTGSLFAQPNPTNPPEKQFASIEEFSAAVVSAKTDTSAADVENLKALTYFYGLKNPPDGAKVSSVRVSSEAMIVGYAFGQTSQESFDNQIQIVWYRNQDASQFIGRIASSNTSYSSASSGGIDYLYINPDVQVIVTPAPGADAAAPTPTPLTTKYCQFVYWVQDGAAFMAAVPLGFTKDDIIKYCAGVKMDLK
jgi:hypothetical protein